MQKYVPMRVVVGVGEVIQIGDGAKALPIHHHGQHWSFTCPWQPTMVDGARYDPNATASAAGQYLHDAEILIFQPAGDARQQKIDPRFGIEYVLGIAPTH